MIGDMPIDSQFAIRGRKGDPMTDSSSRKHTHKTRSHTTKLALGLTGVVALAMAATAAASQSHRGRAPDLGTCQNLQVAPQNPVIWHVYAEGVQIYRWNGTSWVFVAPEAVLFADAGGHGQVGFHYAGPTWETFSGSKVVGVVIDRCMPDPTAIPWLKLGAVSKQGPGVLDQVGLIQRVNTVGGIAPAQAGTFPGQEARVPYTTEYFFYRTDD
jgi:hypothetical protein